MRLCHSTQTAEAQAAAETARRLMERLKPTGFVWQSRTTLLAVPLKEARTRKAREGTLKHALRVSPDLVSFKRLSLGEIDCIHGNFLLRLPADRCEPMW